MKKLKDVKTKEDIMPLSYTSMSTFMSCRKIYYFKYVKKYYPQIYQSKFIIGNFANIGLNNIYSKIKNPILTTIKELQIEKQKIRASLQMSATDEQHLNDQEVTIIGMLKAYAKKYAKNIKESTHIKNEKRLDYVTNNGVKIIGKIDNLLSIKNKLYIHELKTSRYINLDYVKNIKNSLQVALYFYMYNKLYKEKIHAIIYDVIKKPSIRQKQKESKEEFIERLYSYYLDKSKTDNFYMEKIKYPLINQKKTFNVIDKISNDISECKTEDDYYHNFNFCYVYGRCEYYDVCFFGENKINLAKFQKPKIKGDKYNEKNNTKKSTV